jgi:hypothetical protein
MRYLICFLVLLCSCDVDVVRSERRGHRVSEKLLFTNGVYEKVSVHVLQVLWRRYGISSKQDCEKLFCTKWNCRL